MSDPESWEAGLLTALKVGGRRAEHACELLLDRWAGPLVTPWHSRSAGATRPPPLSDSP
jgi:hypothetical protein